MINLAEQMADCAAAVDKGLTRLLSATAWNGPGEPPERLLAAMRHGALGGGKRLRPLLLRQSAAIFGIAPEACLAAQLAIECVHCYSLVHDDLPAMDDDDLRRGRPTVHIAFDEATAILAGDALLTLAFTAILDAGFESAIAVRLLGELATGSGAAGMVGGQMRDIEGEATGLNETDIARMQAMKTGALIRAAVRMGAMLGHADTEAMAALTAYGVAAGAAFQLADDLLDLTSTQEVMGKATGKDADRGKQTLVGIIGPDAARRRLGDLIHDAISALTMFGSEAGPLRETARYFATREN